jgi:hypothetical protein
LTRAYRDSRSGTEIEADRRYALLRAASGRLDEFLISAIRKGQTVSKLTAIGDRIKTKKLAHDAKADEWAARLDAIDKREPTAFAVGDAVIAEREADLTEMEGTMRTLSNLPLPGSDGSS